MTGRFIDTTQGEVTMMLAGVCCTYEDPSVFAAGVGRTTILLLIGLDLREERVPVLCFDAVAADFPGYRN